MGKPPYKVPEDPKMKLHAKTKKHKRQIRAIEIGYNDFGADDWRTVMYRNFHEVSEKMYLVEISKSKTKVFCIIFEDYTNPGKFMGSSIPDKIAMKMIIDREYDFARWI